MGIYSIEPRDIIVESTKVISKAKSNVDWVRVYKENDNYYISGKELLEYMDMSNISDFDEAVSNIEEANYIHGIIVNLDECDEYTSRLIEEEANIICEKSIEDNATTVKKQIKWYKDFVKRSKGKADSKKELEERIKVLKECLKQLKKDYNDPKKMVMNMFKYGFKAFIPLNGIYRLIKKHDVFAGLALIPRITLSVLAPTSSMSIAGKAVTNFTKSGYEYIVRLESHKVMIEKCIDDTEEAIKYLEKKLKEFDK